MSAPGMIWLPQSNTFSPLSIPNCVAWSRGEGSPGSRVNLGSYGGTFDDANGTPSLVNGVWTLDGVNDVAKCTYAVVAPAAFTFGAKVANLSVAGNEYPELVACDLTLPLANTGLSSPNGPTFFRMVVNVATPTNTAVPIDTLEHVVVLSWTAGFARLRMDGVLVATDTTNPVTQGVTLLLGAAFGYGAGYLAFAQCTIKQPVVYDRLLNAGELALLEGYLAAL